MVFINICQILISIVIFSNSENAYQLFSMGCQLELEGKIEEAIEYYKQAKELDPSSPEIYISLASASYQIRKFREGINFALEGLAISPENLELYLITATGYIGKGDFKNAIRFYEKALEIEPEDTEIYTAISILYQGSKELDNARKILEDMPEDIRTSEIFERLGELSGKLNDHEIAIGYYQKAYTMDTTNITALVGVGTGYDFLGIKDSAIYHYESVFAKDSFNLWVGKRLVELYSDTDQYEELIKMSNRILARDFYDGYTRRNLGFALYKIGLMNEALIEFLIASRIDPQDTYSKFYAGRIYLEQGDYNRAQREITDAIEINPDFVELWIYLGFISIDMRDFKTAEHAFTEAAYRGGDIRQICYLLGIVAEMQDHPSDAYFYYYKSLAEDPKDLASLEALANLCVRIGRKDGAFKSFQKIITLDTTNAIALNYVGYTYAERSDSLQYALELIDRALSIEKNNGYFIDSRGWVFYQMGRYKEALVELIKACEIIEDAVILEHLGDTYLKLNDPIQAKQIYKRALEFAPDNKMLKNKLLELERNVIEGD